jgi:hypothetical protein
MVSCARSGGDVLVVVAVADDLAAIGGSAQGRARAGPVEPGRW